MKITEEQSRVALPAVLPEICNGPWPTQTNNEAAQALREDVSLNKGVLMQDLKWISLAHLVDGDCQVIGPQSTRVADDSSTSLHREDSFPPFQREGG